MPATRPLRPQWFQILLSLADRELHGTAIMDDVLERTDGAMKLWPGTLYGSLKELADRGLIVEVDPPERAPTEGGKRRFYAITLAGRSRLHDEVERMADLVRLAWDKRIGRGPEQA
jgi:DNA-binding PadR family transcriptional regulator